jgi:predicted RNase H-like nuclease (RuvC/YqgF family)
MSAVNKCPECGCALEAGLTRHWQWSHCVAALRAENERLRAYADKLADALPEGGLPQDIETRRAANAALAQENHELRDAINTSIRYEEHAKALDKALAEKEAENERLRAELQAYQDAPTFDMWPTTEAIDRYNDALVAANKDILDALGE